jgi:Catalase-related immune-responsive
VSPIEETHVVEAFTFELGKVHEQGIKERELQVLANVDTDLCEQVAAALNLPARRANPPRTSPSRRRWCRSWPSRVESMDARSASSPMRVPISPASPRW